MNRLRDRARKLSPKTLTIARLLPNMVTLLALSSGLMSIRFAFDQRWEWAVGAVVIAAFLDNLDGRMARLLSGGTRFGVELDSLSDFLSFSVAPAMILYLWSGGTGTPIWSAAMAYVICGALRLARFNADSDSGAQRFFSGIPSPAAAGFVLAPMIAWLQWGFEILRHPVLIIIFLIVIGLSMVSTIPTLSLKRTRIATRMRLPVLILASLMLVTLLNFFWMGVFFIIVAYALSIPFSIRQAWISNDADQ